MAIAAARSVFRSSLIRHTAARLASEAKAARPSAFRSSTSKVVSRGNLRYPLELSACIDSMQPFHTATASALMTSMLTISRCGFCWLPEGS